MLSNMCISVSRHGGKFISSTRRQVSFSSSVPFTSSFFFRSATSTADDKSVNCNTSCTFSTQSFALLLQMHTTQKTPDSPPYKSGGHFYKRLKQLIPTQWGITAYKHTQTQKKKSDKTIMSKREWCLAWIAEPINVFLTTNDPLHKA